MATNQITRDAGHQFAGRRHLANIKDNVQSIVNNALLTVVINQSVIVTSQPKQQQQRCTHRSHTHARAHTLTPSSLRLFTGLHHTYFDSLIILKLSALVREMQACFNRTFLLQKKLLQNSWNRLFGNRKSELMKFCRNVPW